MSDVGLCSRRRQPEKRQGVQLLSQACGEISGPLLLSGLEQQGPRSVPSDGSTTVWDCLKSSESKYDSRNAVGSRRLLKVHEVQEGGRTFEKLQLENEYRWLTYREYLTRILAFAQGLAAFTGIESGNRLVIYAETQQDWMVAALAAFSISLQVVTIYATLGEQGALFGLQQTKASTIICDAKLLKILAKIAPKCEFLKYVVVIGSCHASDKDMLSAVQVAVATFSEVLGERRPVQTLLRPPSPADVAVIMYTSGTTANPKGVIISHQNIVASIAGFQDAARRSGFSEDLTYLAYLPLAHIMEMVAELSILSMGGVMGYGSPHTLVDSSVKLKRPESEGDAVLLKPTLMVFAPAVLDKVYKGITGKVEAGNIFKRWTFRQAMAAGIRNYDAGGIGAGPLLNRIFTAVQLHLGERVTMALTGSAPLSPDIQKFMQTAFNCPVRQGYGLTETCACATLASLLDNTVKDVGPPQASAVIRLADWPEGGYLNSDINRPDIGMPRGEVLVGGPIVAVGYLVDEDDPDPDIVNKNQTDFISIDGMRYFRSGDIGQITSRGTLQIIDRKKDLWKGPQGEYVALSKVESVLKLCPYVEIPMVYGKTGANFPVALICPSDVRLVKLAADLDLAGAATIALCKSPKIIAEIHRCIEQVCRSSKLADFEIPKRIALIPGQDGQPAWTPENDMLTAAMKLKRPIISRAYEDAINDLYA